MWFLFTSGTYTLKSCMFWLKVPVHYNHMIYLDLGTCTLKSYDISCLQVRVYWDCICFDFRYLYTEIIWYILTSGACTLKLYDISWLQVAVHWNHIFCLQVPVHKNRICFDLGACTLKSYTVTSGTCTLKLYDIFWLRYLCIEIVWYVLTSGTCTLKSYVMFWLQVPVHTGRRGSDAARSDLWGRHKTYLINGE